MEYQLYTVPRCYGCDEVKSFLAEKGVQYDVLNLRNPEHKKVFGKIYFDIESGLRKNRQKQTILPLLVEKNNSGGVERFAQEAADIKDLFN